MCVVLSIYNNSSSAQPAWSKEWAVVLQPIAMKSPALLPEASKRNLEADLASNSVLRVKFDEKVRDLFTHIFDLIGFLKRVFAKLT
jgi:hypothetical protein